MRVFRLVFLIVMAIGLAACSSSKFRTYNGPEVTHEVVKKSQRRMYLLHHDKVLKSYDIGLGFHPQGHKQFEGDGKTPEGLYFIDRRNPNSSFHLSLGISYPNPNDRAFAAAAGKSPGGDIFIHGGPPKDRKRLGGGDWMTKGNSVDWTWGCIAVSDDQIEHIYAMVKTGTPITISR